MSVSVLNTNASLSGKTVTVNENADTITGLKTFDLDPSAPFAVTSGSAKVTNLDADKVDGIEGTNLAEINNTETISSVWTFSAKPAINAGLQFPATQASSADANTLDDYEEGSWTPTVTSSGGGTATYSVQVARYLKIGRCVFFSGRLTLSSKAGLSAGNVQLAGLPFTSDTTTNLFSTATVGYWDALTTALYAMPAHIQYNTTAVVLNKITAATTTVGQLTVADISNTTDLIFSGTYLATQ
jgi:hypothetical protein